MPLGSIYNALRKHDGWGASSSRRGFDDLKELVSRTWHFGFTAFGGPPAHFQIFHKAFVQEQSQRTPWIDEQTYQELFALCQGLPGPASTKMLFVTVLVKFGLPYAILSFMMWSLPGAIGMFALSLGTQRISEVLPDPAYAFLSGLNAAIVGIIALAAVQLSEKCIKDRISRMLVIFGACAGLCYSALWYYPVLVVTGGIATLVWDLWLGRALRRLRHKLKEKRQRSGTCDTNAEEQADTRNLVRESGSAADVLQTTQMMPSSSTASNKTSTVFVQRRPVQSDNMNTRLSMSASNTDSIAVLEAESSRSHLQQLPSLQPLDSDADNAGLSVRTGLLLLTAFVISLTLILVTRSQLSTEYRPLSLFANMYVAGTIIFGGGPVVIPLLREYVVAPGWVSPRDFLIGLAIIQAFPGPNFNFAVYLGALAMAPTSKQIGNSFAPSLLGAFLGYAGIFTPGLVFAICSQVFWRKLRTKPAFVAILRGINATAVGLVFTAVYRIWEVGYLSSTSTHGSSLAKEPWWVVVAVLTYAGNRWFGIPAAIGIVTGGIFGLAWWGATQA